jgi:hypothetical protein
MLYRIVRRYRDNQRSEVLASNLTEAQAQAHCRGTETSSSTCTRAAAQARTDKYGPWFVGYEEQAPKRQPQRNSLTRALVGIYQNE